MGFGQKSDIRTMKDGRLILRNGSLPYARMRRELAGLAAFCCEECGVRVELNEGHADHVYGRGGGRRDDRIFVAGRRNLRWLCPGCHSGKHNPKAVPSKKMSDAEFKQLLGLEGA